MTKARPPLTIDAAISRIAGHLPRGFEGIACITNRAVRTCRNWSDPDTPENIPIDCAIELDLAYQAAGGVGAPIFETYALKLELAATNKFADAITLARRLPDIIRECGEANAALIEAADPSATPVIRRNALRECEEAMNALKAVMPLIQEPQPPP